MVKRGLLALLLASLGVGCTDDTYVIGAVCGAVRPCSGAGGGASAGNGGAASGAGGMAGAAGGGAGAAGGAAGGFALDLTGSGVARLPESLFGTGPAHLLISSDALATSWPAFRTLVYDVAIDAPAQLGATVGGAASLDGGGSALTTRLSETDRALRTLNAWGIGNEPNRAGVSDDQGIEPDTTYETKALGAARMSFLTGAIGSIALTRLAAGVLLALAPLFIAFLLFDATRGLFGGWLRGLIGLTLGTTASSLVIAVETAIVQPRVVTLINLRASGYSIQ